MPQFLIESPHQSQDCLAILDQVLAAGYLTHFSWGCMAGEHCGWVILEAESEKEARMVVPSLVRDKARIVQLYVFNADEVKKLHQKK